MDLFQNGATSGIGIFLLDGIWITGISNFINEGLERKKEYEGFHNNNNDKEDNKLQK